MQFVNYESFLFIFFVYISLNDKSIAAINGNIKKYPNFNSLGLITTTTPAKPRITAVHLLHRTFSFRNKAPKVVKIIGARLNNT
jgi:hypothetical protein